MSTDCLFREDSYLKECSATVVGLTEAGGVVLDRTVFYAASGGQPADRGVLTTATGDAILIEGASYTDAGKTEIAHLPAATTGLSLKVGEPVHARHRLGPALCPHAHAYRAASALGGAALSGHRRLGRRQPTDGSTSTFPKPASTRTRSPASSPR